MTEIKPLRPEKKKGGKGTEPLTAGSNTDYANGHPYSSVIYDFLRMVRKLTKSRSSYSGGVLSVFDGENGRGFRRKMEPGQMCDESLLSCLLFFYGLSYHTNNNII